MIWKRVQICVLTSIGLLVGCSAKPAPDAGFLQQPQLMKPEKDFPFNRIYVNPKYAQKQYTEIYIAPVSTEHMLRLSLWEVFSEAYLFPNDVKKNQKLLAQYLHDAYAKAIAHDPQAHLKVVDQPGPDTLIVETAIVQLVASKPILYLAGYYWLAAYIGTVVVPIALNSEDQGNGLIAMETRLRDGQTGEIVAMYADRQRAPLAAFNATALAWWEPVKPIVDDWATEFVQIEEGLRGKQVKQIPAWAIITFDKF